MDIVSNWQDLEPERRTEQTRTKGDAAEKEKEGRWEK